MEKQAKFILKREEFLEKSQKYLKVWCWVNVSNSSKGIKSTLSTGIKPTSGGGGSISLGFAQEIIPKNNVSKPIL